jgi:sulfate-transporting ATPase
MVFTNFHASGDSAGVVVGNAKLFGLDIGGASHPERYAAFTLIVFVLACIVVANLRRGRLGRRMVAVRSNERCCCGVRRGRRTKMIAFAISGALAGLAGVLISFQYEAATFVTFDPFTSLLTVAWIVISGVGFVLGAINPGALLAPGALLSLIGLHWPGFVGWLPLIGEFGTLFAVRFNQDGITSNNVRNLPSSARSSRRACAGPHRNRTSSSRPRRRADACAAETVGH